MLGSFELQLIGRRDAQMNFCARNPKRKLEIVAKVSAFHLVRNATDKVGDTVVDSALRNVMGDVVPKYVQFLYCRPEPLIVTVQAQLIDEGFRKADLLMRSKIGCSQGVGFRNSLSNKKSYLFFDQQMTLQDHEGHIASDRKMFLESLEGLEDIGLRHCWLLRKGYKGQSGL